MKKLITITILLLTASTAFAGNKWEYKVRVDNFSGEKIDYVDGQSINKIRGWLHSNFVFISIVCSEKAIHIKVPDVGLNVDKIECHRSCEDFQYSRIRFDDSPSKYLYFHVDDIDNNHMLRLDKKYGNHISNEEIINGMKAGTKMYLEITPFNVEDQRQMAEFDLRDFTYALNRCKAQ